MAIRLMVFDWAGTIIDFGCRAPLEAFVQVFAEAGISVTEAEARRPMGLHKKDHIREMLRALPRPWTEAEVEELYRRVTPRQIAAAQAYSTLIPGVVEVAAELRKRSIAIATTTGYFQAAAEVCYTAAEQQGFVPDARICADEVPHGRPAPWMLFRVMEALGIYPPQDVMKLGDTAHDIQEAKNAGAWAVGIVDSSNEMGLSLAAFAALPAAEQERRREPIRELFLDAGADAVIDTIDELPAAIDAINSQTGVTIELA
jgi:phosphonoacetaldehyde hydrolase